MKRHLYILLVALTPVTVFAQQIDQEEAREIALNFSNRQDGALKAASRDAGTVTLSYTAKTGKKNDFYVFNYPDESGFIIVSADNRTVSPVLAYSDQGSFDSENIPSNAGRVLSSYQKQIGALRRSKAPSRPTVSDPIEPTVLVGPLISTKWNQSSPYNGMCPIDRLNGRRSVTGCIATAMAQIMNYWKWPEKGHGFHYNYSDTLLRVNYDESVYNWDMTLDEYYPESDSLLILDIQKIMFDCGVAANMQYGSGGSAAFDESLKKALTTYFNYSSAVRLVKYEDVYWEYDDPDSVWVSLIKNELDNSRPLVMSGQDLVYGEGHAFICDGYDDRGYFHFNFGWGGYLDAYFLPTAINLSDGSSYNSYQTITIGIEPDRSGTYLDGYPVCRIEQGQAILEDIIEPYDTPHVLEIPSQVIIDNRKYPVSAIINQAFAFNPAITGVTIPTSVYQIMDYAFYGCPRIESVELPKSIVFYGYGAFGGCDNLKQLTVHRDNPYYYSADNSVIDWEYNKIIQGCNYSRIPAHIEVIGANAFEGFNGLVTVVFPASVTGIESEAFYNCPSLASVTLGENMAAIGRDAFGECPSLRNVYSLSSYPPQIQETSFPAGVTVHVPKGASEAYHKDAYWSAFIIVDDIADPTKVVPMEADGEEPAYWDLMGRPADRSVRGIRISNGRKFLGM